MTECPDPEIPGMDKARQDYIAATMRHLFKGIELLYEQGLDRDQRTIPMEDWYRSVCRPKPPIIPEP